MRYEICAVCNLAMDDVDNHYKISLHKVNESTHESFIESVVFHQRCSFTKATQTLTDHLIRTYMVNKV